MMTLPKTIQYPARPYIFVPFTVAMDELQKPAQEGFPKLFAHIEKHGLEPDGAAFYNYRRIDMARTLDVEAGIALQAPGPGEGDVQTGTLPGGDFLSLAWHGHPDSLEMVTGMLIGWARLTGEHFDMHEAPDGDHFACRLEIYESDPEETPDLNDWETTLAFKLRDRA